MAPAQGRENVAVFNPIVLALPDWHPDGPDGDVDGYVIPFVFPEARDGRTPNRDARIQVYEGRAMLRNCQDHAETADQARAFAGAWIRAAEVLEAVQTKPPATRAEQLAGDVEHQGASTNGAARAGCPACSHGTCTLHSDEVKPT